MQVLPQVYCNLESPVYQFLAVCILKALHFATIGSPVLSCAPNYAWTIQLILQTMSPRVSSLSVEGGCVIKGLSNVKDVLLKLICLQQFSPQPDLEQHGILDVK